MANLATLIDQFGESIVRYSNPTLDYDNRATKDLPFIPLSQALPVALGYLVLCAYGYNKMVNEPKPVPSATPVVTDAAKDKPVWTWASALQKLNKDKLFPVSWIMLFYNIVQVVLCGYMMVQAALIAYTHYNKPICNPHNDTKSELAPILWLFYVSKILDFFDTTVIIIRSTWNQFSFLHTYHHFSIFLTYWLVANAGFDGDVYYTVVANSFVHFVMYFYYGLKVLGIKVSWDIAVTSLQMFQFLTMNAQAIYILYFGCPYPNRVTAFYLVYIISLFSLFAHFFIQKYGGRSKGKSSSSTATGTEGKKSK